MGLLARLLLGKGTLNPEVRAQLEAEGLVLAEEGLSGSVRYRHFKAPGKRFHRKITAERLAIGVSTRRVVVYCRSGRAKLVDLPFADPLARVLEVPPAEGDRVSLLIDYSRVDHPRLAGQVTISARTPNAARIAAELRARL